MGRSQATGIHSSVFLLVTVVHEILRPWPLLSLFSKMLEREQLCFSMAYALEIPEIKTPLICQPLAQGQTVPGMLEAVV